METETKTRPPRNGRLSLYPLKFEDALRALAKAKPEARKAKTKKRVEYRKRA
jgi:hypothetical protein